MVFEKGCMKCVQLIYIELVPFKVYVAFVVVASSTPFFIFMCMNGGNCEKRERESCLLKATAGLGVGD